MKKLASTLFLLLFAACLLTGVQPAASAAEMLHSGTCGENVTWTLTDDGTLTISGSGPMTDYSRRDNPPWFSYFASITSVVVEDGVSSIGSYTCYIYPNLTSVKIGDSVTVIGYSAFHRCTGLTEIEIPDSVITVDEYAFYGCTALANVELGSSVATIGFASFEECTGLTSVVIPDSVTVIDDGAFGGCTGLTNVELGSSVTTIGNSAFADCTGLTSIVLPDSVTDIVGYAFQGCTGLTSVEMGNSVTSIGKSAFYSCTSLTSIVIPDSVTTIDEYAFEDCTDLTDVVVGSSVATIGTGAFSGCSALTTVTFLGDAPGRGPWSSNTDIFPSVSATIYYPAYNPTWTEEAMEGYGGSITWVADDSRHVHEYASAVTDPTCTERGYTTYTCVCGEAYQADYVDALGHTYVVETVPPTATERGWTEHYCTVCSYSCCEDWTAATGWETDTVLPAETSNLNAQNYVGYWSSVVDSYLVDNGDGTVTRVEYDGTQVNVEIYDADFRLISRRVLAMELPIFGGFYAGEEYNFLIFGQTNKEEDDEVEVFRVVRYTKDWERTGRGSLYGTETTIPFRAGSLRATESNGILYIRTCREKYHGYDGINHQTNLTILMDQSNMNMTAFSSFYGFVSHSFNQFILVEGETILAVEHGDAGPRSVVLFRGDLSWMETEIDLFPICPVDETHHYNYTGVSVGGFEYSDRAYLVAGNTISQEEDQWATATQRNIFLTVTPKEDCSEEGTVIYYLTDHAEGDGVSVSNPHLVKIDGNCFLVLWTENGSLRYVFVDGLGKQTSEIYKADASLSDCKPIVLGRSVCWYVTSRSTPKFYQISLDDPASGAAHEHSYTAVVTASTCTEQGYTTHTCACGDSYVDSYTQPTCVSSKFSDVPIDAWYHSYVDFVVERGLMNGTGGDKFAPTAVVTRATVAQLLYNMEGRPDVSGIDNPFSDVEEGAWYYAAVVWAADAGVVSGNGKGGFDPNNNVTREQLAIMLYNYAKAKGYDLADSGDVELGSFPDGGKTSTWAAEQIRWACGVGLIGGKSVSGVIYLAPQDTATRAEIATIIMRFYQMAEEN